MEKIFVKVEFNGTVKKITLPDSFNEFVESTSGWTKIDTEKEDIYFVESKTNLEIKDENSMMKFLLQNSRGKTSKLIIKTKPKVKEELPKEKILQFAGLGADQSIGDQIISEDFNSNKNNPIPNSNTNPFLLYRNQNIKDIPVPDKNNELNKNGNENDNDNGKDFNNKKLEKENSEEEEEKKIRESLNPYLEAKLNSIQDKIVEDIYSCIVEKSKVSNIQLKTSNINNNQKKNEDKDKDIDKNKDDVIYVQNVDNIKSKAIHYGISCENCGQYDIKGVRYKCIKCRNYNLCEKCESKGVHDIYHILLKINYPDEIGELSQFCSVSDYPVDKYNFNIENTHFTFHLNDFSTEHQAFVNFQNTGKEPFATGFWFAHLQNPTGIKASDVRLLRDVPAGINGCLAVEFDIDGCVPGKYYTFWQMKNSEGQYFGKVVQLVVDVVP